MICNIIIPVYNLKEHLALCLESIKKYTHVPYRIILIDDCSVDGTTDYIRSLKGNNIIKIFNDTGKKWMIYKASNMGLKASKADYYVFLDRDCIVSENWLTKMIECFDKYPNIGIVTCSSNGGGIDPSFCSDTHFRPIYQDFMHRDGKELCRSFFEKRNPHYPPRTDLPDTEFKAMYSSSHWIYWLISEGEIQRFADLVEEHYKGQVAYQTPICYFVMVISQETINRIGFFDERFNIWQGDWKFSGDAWNEGLKTVVRRDVYIHHYKFPPLTKIELEKCPYLEKYGVKWEDAFGEDAKKTVLQSISSDVALWKTMKDNYKCVAKPVTVKHKNVIITQALGGSFLKMLDIVLPFMEHYAEKVNADLIVIKDPVIAKMFKTQTWFECFQFFDLCKDYERMLYTDVDVIIRPDAPNIFDVADKDKIAVVEEAPERGDGNTTQNIEKELNMAFGEVSWDKPYFLSGMMVVPNKYLYIFDYRRYKDLDKYQDIGKYDFGQGILNYQIRKEKIPIQYLDDKWGGIENKIYKVGINKDKAYFMHFTCLGDKRIPWIKEYAEKWKKKLPVRFGGSK